MQVPLRPAGLSQIAAQQHRRDNRLQFRCHRTSMTAFCEGGDVARRQRAARKHQSGEIVNEPEVFVGRVCSDFTPVHVRQQCQRRRRLWSWMAPRPMGTLPAQWKPGGRRTCTGGLRSWTAMAPAVAALRGSLARYRGVPGAVFGPPFSFVKAVLAGALFSPYFRKRRAQL